MNKTKPTPITHDSLPVLLIDDEPNILFSYGLILKSAGLKDVITIQDSRQALQLLAEKKIGVIVLDLFMPELLGAVLLPHITRDFPEIPVIVMTASNELETAVECMKSGAIDYLVKPVEKNRFVSSVKRALEARLLHEETVYVRDCIFTDRIEKEEAFSDITTNSLKMKKIFQYIEAVSGSSQPALITGETGVGKEAVAKAIHIVSGLAGAFIAVNVAGLDDAMFSDTLFGHKKGAFTGAEKEREGLLAAAAGGTLFLDEIGDLSEVSQVKLLRLLQGNEYYPAGSDSAVKSEARIIVATNHNLEELTAKGKFRKDLYYRLSYHKIHIPPLRERKEDIPLLLGRFLEDAAKAMNRSKPTPPPELATLLSLYDFPGNIRELQAMVHDAVARHKSGVLSMESFRNTIGDKSSISEVQARPGEGCIKTVFGHFPTLKEAENYLISEALSLSKDNQSIAASMLGLTRQALNKRLSRKEQ